jgi:hypothetical protein
METELKRAMESYEGGEYSKALEMYLGMMKVNP